MMMVKKVMETSKSRMIMTTLILLTEKLTTLILMTVQMKRLSQRLSVSYKLSMQHSSPIIISKMTTAWSTFTCIQ